MIDEPFCAFPVHHYQQFQQSVKFKIFLLTRHLKPYFVYVTFSLILSLIKVKKSILAKVQ